MSDVTVITPSLPERHTLLDEACESVAHQTRQPALHLIGIDYERVGAATMRNSLLDIVETEYVAFLDDDDLLYPRHLDVLCSKLDDNEKLTVAWSWCESRGGPDIPRPTFFSAQAMMQANFIPVTVVARTVVLQRVGGFPLGAEEGHEDWALWRKLVDQKFQFDVVHEVTWVYRFGAGA